MADVKAQKIGSCRGLREMIAQNVRDGIVCDGRQGPVSLVKRIARKEKQQLTADHM